MKRQSGIIFFLGLKIVFLLNIGYTESVEEIDRRANEFFKKKLFSRAITEWLYALEIAPDNEKIQNKIEIVYEQKHRKDFAIQKSNLYLKLARKMLKPDTIDLCKTNTEKAISNFIIAYRIDPNDSEVLILKEKLRRLQRDLQIELEKRRLSAAMLKLYKQHLNMAKKLMLEKKYKQALIYWNKILDIYAKDKVALEGKRKAELAISNRIKFEKIAALLAQGLLYFNNAKYHDALQEYKQVLKIDPENDEAEDYIDRIEDKLDEQRNRKRREMQAEQFYLSGIHNIKINNFNAARDDFENVLTLIKNYKDAPYRLRSIDRLEKEYLDRIRRRRLEEIDKEFQNGLIFLAAGKYKESLVSFEKLIRMDPNNKLVQKYIQTAKEALFKYQEEVVDKNSPYYSIVSSLIVTGKKLYQKQEYSESRQNWEKILKLFPKNRTATEYLLKCELKINPKSYKKFANRLIIEGKNYLKEKKYKYALNNFELIKSISPNYPGLNLLIKKARNIKTVKVVKNATPQQLNNRYKAATSLYRKGGKDNILEARKNLLWIVKNDPDNNKALIFLNKIEAQLRIGKDSGIVKKRKLSARQKQLVRKYYFRGINYYSNNKFEKAISEWRKVLAIDPDHSKSKNNIRKCLSLLRK